MRGLKLGVFPGFTFWAVSHLLQMRGLKPGNAKKIKAMRASHLLQMRGLKQTGTNIFGKGESRIFYRCVDWNLYSITTVFSLICRIFYRCVDWNLLRSVPWNCVWRRIFYRCVDWNMSAFSIQKAVDVASFTDAWIETYKWTWLWNTSKSRIFYRCVDWNPMFQPEGFTKLGRIFYRCVDWNRYFYQWFS